MSGLARWRVLNAEPAEYSDEARRLLEEVANLDERTLDRKGLLAAVPSADALIVRLRFQIDAEVLDAAPRLKAIVSATTGLDHIGLDAAPARNVAVLSLRGETEFLRTIRATSEHTWALLLALLRGIPAADASVRRGQWNRDAFRAHELFGRNLRLIGLGRVGWHVAGYGLAFGMNVAANDPAAAEWMDGIERRSSLPSLVRDADVVSVHVPLDATTRGLVDATLLAAVPRHSVLINTSRGEVLDERAVAARCADGGWPAPRWTW